VAFNREHVIPQAFGVFDRNNMALGCVCCERNPYFGDGIDRRLAREASKHSIGFNSG
jgi:hypothetical protein